MNFQGRCGWRNGVPGKPLSCPCHILHSLGFFWAAFYLPRDLGVCGATHAQPADCHTYGTTCNTLESTHPPPGSLPSQLINSVYGVVFFPLGKLVLSLCFYLDILIWGILVLWGSVSAWPPCPAAQLTLVTHWLLHCCDALPSLGSFMRTDPRFLALPPHGTETHVFSAFELRCCLRSLLRFQYFQLECHERVWGKDHTF